MGEKADSDLVRRQNRRLVLGALRQRGNLARVELGRATGLSPASITAISAQLIDENVIEEVATPMGQAREAKRGRPIVRLALRPEVGHVVAVKISIDDAVLVLADFAGCNLAEEDIHIPTYEASEGPFAERLAHAITSFVERHGSSLAQVRRIGIALQGLPDQRNGSILWSPAFSERHVPLVDVLEARLAVPCHFANDANMIAEGLVTQDPEQFSGVSAVIFIGYGVGMGIVIHGEVFHGSSGAAAEFGHMNHLPGGAKCRCGRRGCIEAYVADYALLRLTEGQDSDEAQLSAIEPQRMVQLILQAQQGDAKARKAFEIAGQALGYGIARLIAILNPDRIVLAGPGLRARSLIEPAMMQAISDGVVEDLSRGVRIDYVDFTQDMILRGTVDTLLRSVDLDLSSASGVREESVSMVI